MKRVLNSEKL